MRVTNVVGDGPDLRRMIPMWKRYMTAEKLAKGTIAGYLYRAGLYLDWCESRDYPVVIDRRQVIEYTADLVERGLLGNTVLAYQTPVRRLTAWLVLEGELAADVLVGLPRPDPNEVMIEPLTVAELGAMVKTCRPGRTLKDRTFRDVRDEAVIRVFADTGIRANELVGIDLADVDTDKGEIVLRKRKGGRGSRVGIGAQTCVAIDRYLRWRDPHRLAAKSSRLFLGANNKTFAYEGLRHTLARRAEQVGITGFHIHRLRHTFADRWLEAGGSETGLMEMANWLDPKMLRRYTRARAQQRALDEARRLSLGDL